MSNFRDVDFRSTERASAPWSFEPLSRSAPDTRELKAEPLSFGRALAADTHFRRELVSEPLQFSSRRDMGNSVVYRSLDSAPASQGVKLDLSSEAVASKSFPVLSSAAGAGRADFGSSGMKETSLGLPVAPLVDTQLSLSKVAEMRELKLLPLGLRKHTSFVASKGPTDSMAIIQEALRSPRLNFQVSMQSSGKQKLKGLGIQTGTKIVFIIHLYRSSSDEVVVECARETGCIVLFNNLYNGLLNVLGDLVLRRYCAPLSSQAHIPNEIPSSPPPCAPSDSSALSLAISRLMERACSPFLDEKLEAGEALLASANGNEWSRALELECCAGLLNVIEGFLRSSSEDTLRVGAALLSNVLQRRETFKHHASAQLLALLFELLDGPVTYLNSETKRHISSALTSIRSTRQEAFSPAQLLVLERRPLWDPIPTLRVLG